MTTDVHTGDMVFLPHSFLHTNEDHSPHMTLTDEGAAAALCALPSAGSLMVTSTATRGLDPKSYQNLWTQIKDCSDRLHDLTSVPFATASPVAANAGPTSLFPLLQQLLGLFHTFNSSVQQTQSAASSELRKRKMEQMTSPSSPSSSHDDSAMLVVKSEPCGSDERGSESDHSSDQTAGPSTAAAALRKRARRVKPKSELVHLYCFHCGETDTPEWRRGPQGPKTLCNACGLQYAKFLREADKREKCRMPLSLVLNA